MSEESIVILESSDGERFEVPRKVAFMSQLVKDTLAEADDDDDDDDGENAEPESIPLINVSTKVLEKVIAFCSQYQEDPMTPIQTPLKSNELEQLVQPWYADFVKVDKDVLFSLVAAANFLDIKQLLDLTCLAVSILIKGKSAAELRDMFNISAELTPEETAQIQQENNQWTAAAEGGAVGAAGDNNNNNNNAEGAAAPEGDNNNAAAAPTQP